MLTGRPAAWAQSLAIPSKVTALSLTMLKMLPLAASGLSTARVSTEDRSLTWEMFVSCIPEPGIGTGLSRTIPVQSIPVGKYKHKPIRLTYNTMPIYELEAIYNFTQIELLSSWELSSSTYDQRTTPRNLCCCQIQSCIGDETLPMNWISLQCISPLQHDLHQPSQHPIACISITLFQFRISNPAFKSVVLTTCIRKIIPLQHEEAHQLAYKYQRCWCTRIALHRSSLPNPPQAYVWR